LLLSEEEGFGMSELHDMASTFRIGKTSYAVLHAHYGLDAVGQADRVSFYTSSSRIPSTRPTSPSRRSRTITCYSSTASTPARACTSRCRLAQTIDVRFIIAGPGEIDNQYACAEQTASDITLAEINATDTPPDQGAVVDAAAPAPFVRILPVPTPPGAT
jgi:hypothetical protein